VQIKHHEKKYKKLYVFCFYPWTSNAEHLKRFIHAASPS